MASNSIKIEYYHGKPAWKVQDPNPQPLLQGDYKTFFKLFPFPQGAIIACWLQILEGEKVLMDIHRVYDLSDPIVYNFLNRMCRQGEILFLVENPELGEILERPILLLGSNLLDLLTEGSQYNKKLETDKVLYGLDSLEIFLKEFNSLEKSMKIDEIWKSVDKKLEEKVWALPAKESQEESDEKSDRKEGDKNLSPPMEKKTTPPSSLFSPPPGVGASSDGFIPPYMPTQDIKSGKVGSGDKGPSGSDILGSFLGGKGAKAGSAWTSPLPPALPPAPSPSPVSLYSKSTGSSSPSESTLNRQGTVRYFPRMYPFHTYPLRVIISGGKIREIQISGLREATGEKPFAISAANPIVTILPIFPGALVIPEQVEVDVSGPIVETEFWVTPQTEGNLEQARVELHHEGKVIHKILTPYKVTKNTLAKLSLFFSFVFPLLSPLLEKYQITLENQISAGFPLFQPFFQMILQTPKMAGFLGFAFLAALLYWARKPKESDPITQFLSMEALLESGPANEPSVDSKVSGNKKDADQFQNKGLDCMDLADLDGAIQNFKSAYAIYRKLSISYDYGNLLCNLGVAYLDKGYYEEALLVYAEELSVWVRLAYEKERGRCLSNLGVLYQSMKNLEKAQVYFKEAVDVRYQAGDTPGEIYSSKLLAKVYRDLGKWKEARQIYDRLLILTKDNRSEYGRILQLRGVVEAAQTDYLPAIEDYTKALEIFVSAGTKRDQADIYFNMGLAYEGKGEFKTALEKFQSSLRLSQEGLSLGEAIPQKDIDEVQSLIKKLNSKI